MPLRHPEFHYVDFARGDVRARNRVVDIFEAVADARNGASYNSYITVFRFPGAYAEHCARTGSVRGYDGPAYSDFLPFDIDREGDLAEALRGAVSLAHALQDQYDLRPDQVRYFFSGAKGFHLLIPTELFGDVQPSPLLPQVWKRMAVEIAEGAGEKIDPVIYDANRLFRLPNTKHPTSGLWKVELSWDDLLNHDAETIQEMAATPRAFRWEPHDLEPLDPLVELYGRHLAEAAAAPAAGGALRSAGGGVTVDLAVALEKGYTDGQKHNLVLAFAGYAAKRHLPRETAHGVVDELLEPHDDPVNLHTAVDDTYDRVRQGLQVKGYTELRALLPEAELAALAELLGDRRPPAAPRGETAPPADPPRPGSPAASAPAEAPILDPGDPAPGAREFVRRRFTEGEWRTLHHQAGVFYGYDGRAFPELEEAAVRADLWRFAEGAKRWKKEDLVPFAPTSSKINNLLDATRAVTHLPATRQAPCWLDARANDPPAQETVALENGLLHVPTREIFGASPRFYTHNALDFAYDPGQVETPAAWLDFLQQLWPDDPQSIATLQEILGYLLLPDTRQQKAFLLVGPKRSGKGTIGRIITALMGARNVCGPTLGSFAGPFGLQPLLGKLLALISDARLSGRADQAVIAERILSISGEDTVTVDRKHLPSWTGRLPTRFLILTNELPRLSDASGALASRFIVLVLERSFYGHEDPGLTDRLMKELPGIFDWALDGWERLAERGYFIQPQSAAEAVQELEDLGSPISTFLRERCIIEPGRSIACKALYEDWKRWCEAQGRDHTGNLQAFGKDLRAAVPGLRTTQPRIGGVQSERFYEGIGTR